MPITMTVHEIARRIRVDLAADDVASDVYLDLADLLESSTNEVLQYAGSETPDVNLNTALVRLIGYVWDSPGSWRNANFASAFLNSGAAHALNPWRNAQGRGTNAADAPRRADTPESGIMSPADADALQQAIADYLAQHPIETEKGDKGDKGDDSTVAGPRGLRGPGPTDAVVASAVSDYLAANPSGGARTVDQIGGNVEPDGSFSNGQWVAFELQTGQTIADTDLLEFEVTQTSTNRKVGTTITGRAFNALPNIGATPSTDVVPNGSYAVRMARNFESQSTQFGHAQAQVAKTTGTTTTIYFAGSHGSAWRGSIVRCWRTT